MAHKPLAIISFVLIALLGLNVFMVFAASGDEAPNTTITLQMPFTAGEQWRSGGGSDPNAGSFYGEGAHTNSSSINGDYYAVDWNQSGIDEGKALLPVADGEVIAVATPGPGLVCPDTPIGCFVEILHANGYRTKYGHMQVVSVTVGSLVRTSTLIGRVGDSGNNTTGPHLHLSFRRYGTSRCNQAPTCPNGENPSAPQGHKPSPIRTTLGSSALTDGGTYTSVNGRIYVPDLQNNYAGNNRVSVFYVRNDGTEPRTVTIYYYYSNGSPTPRVSDVCVLNPNQICQIKVADFSRIPSGSLGSAYIDGGEAISVAITQKRTGPPFSDNAITGVSSSKANLSFYVPLAMRSVSGAGDVVSSSRILIQNANAVAVTVKVDFLKASGSPGNNYTKNDININSYGSYFYDQETESNLTQGWYGSAVVSVIGSNNPIVVVSALKSSSDAFQSLNTFPNENVSIVTWVAPLFTSRLSNGLSTPVTVQNVSGSQIAINGLSLICTPATSGLQPFTKTNLTPIDPNQAYYFNPVSDFSIPGNWYGSCRIAASASIVSFVQMRFTTGPVNAAAYEAVKIVGTDKVVVFPLIAKRLFPDGLATAATIQNLSSAQANVTLMYYGAHSSVVLPNCTNTQNFGPWSFTIPGNYGSLIRNHRLSASGLPEEETGLPNNWCGSLIVISSNQPIDGFVQLTNYYNPTGDAFLAHNVITRP